MFRIVILYSELRYDQIQTLLIQMQIHYKCKVYSTERSQSETSQQSQMKQIIGLE